MLKFNNKTPRRIKFNGKNLQELVYNGVTVYLRRLYKSDGSFPITLEKAWDENMEDYKIYGESIQDGEPTPETPIEVESVGDKTKNLLDISLIKNKFPTYMNVDSNIGLLDLTSAISTMYSEGIPVFFPAGSIFSCNVLIKENMATNGRFRFVYEDGEVTEIFITNATGGISSQKKQIRFSKNVAFLRFNWGNFNNGFIVDSVSVTTEETDTYEPYGYKVPVKVSSKNLFNSTSQIVKWVKDDIDLRNALNNLEPGEYTMSFKIKLKELTNPNVQCMKGCVILNSTGFGNVSFLTDWSSKIIDTINYVGVRIIVSDSSKGLFTHAYLYGCGNNTTGATGSAEIYEIQIEQGGTATDYTPYFEPYTENIYLDEPLRKADDYADYIDFKNKKVVRYIKVYQGEWWNNQEWRTFKKEWKKSGSGINRYYYAVAINEIGMEKKYLCNVGRISLTGYANSVVGAMGNISDTGLSIVMPSTLNTVDLVREFMINNAILLNYLDTPTEESIELPDIPLQQGDNIISVETKIQPSKGELEYWRGL